MNLSVVFAHVYRPECNEHLYTVGTKQVLTYFEYNMQIKS